MRRNYILGLNFLLRRSALDLVACAQPSRTGRRDEIAPDRVMMLDNAPGIQMRSIGGGVAVRGHDRDVAPGQRRADHPAARRAV